MQHGKRVVEQRGIANLVDDRSLLEPGPKRSHTENLLRSRGLTTAGTSCQKHPPGASKILVKSQGIRASLRHTTRQAKTKEVTQSEKPPASSASTRMSHAGRYLYSHGMFIECRP